MTYEEWCKTYPYWLKEAWVYNRWQKKALKRLLSDLAPRIDKLNRQAYNGCGFHYSLVQSLGKVLPSLAISWQPCANHCDKVWKQDEINIITRVIVEDLFKQVSKAERSVQELRP